MTSDLIKRFRTIPEKIAALNAALSDRNVQEALMLIHLANIPAETGIDSDVLVSRNYHKMLGAHEAMKTLRQMATPITEKEELEPMPEDFYDYIDPMLLPQKHDT